MPVPETADIALDPERFEGVALERLKALIQEGLDSGSPEPARGADEIKRRGRERLRTLRGA
jgi:hypothetical protein